MKKTNKKKKTQLVPAKQKYDLYIHGTNPLIPNGVIFKVA